MTTQNKMIITVVAAPLALILLSVFYKRFKDQQMMNDMKSVLAQSRVVDMNTLSSYGIVDPMMRLIFPSNNVYFNLNSCCSEQQFAKSSRKFYKSGTTTEDGQTYREWCAMFWGSVFPEHLTVVVFTVVIS